MSLSTNFSMLNNTINANQQPDHLMIALLTIDHIVKYYGILIHLIFIIILISSKKLKTRNLLYVNHATITNSFYCIMLLIFTYDDHPKLQNEDVNNFLCSIFEISWIFSIYLRMYSILLISLYRYLAVFQINAFKKLNDSLVLLILPLVLIWSISISFPIITKNAFNTKSSYTFCLDGFSSILVNTVLYCVVNYLFMIIIPAITVILIYIKITFKLNKTKSKFRKSFKYENSSVNTIATIENNKNQASSRTSNTKQKRFANQFILMCSSLIASSFVHAIFSLRTLINYFVVFYYWRPVLRAYIIVVISMIPIITLYYHPNRSKLFRRIKAFICSKMNKA